MSPNHQPVVWAVVPAGGSGQRFGGDKLLATLAGQPVLQRTLSVLASYTGIGGIVVAAPAERLLAYQAAIGEMVGSCNCSMLLVAGGKTRRDSVFKGLQALPPECEFTVVHDGARPLVTHAALDATLLPVLSGEAEGAVIGYPVVDTIKAVTDMDGHQAIITETPPRKALWAVQTPQVFKKDGLMAAHQQVGDEAAMTDDAQLMEMAFPDKPVITVKGHGSNIKITSPSDLALAEYLISQG